MEVIVESTTGALDRLADRLELTGLCIFSACLWLSIVGAYLGLATMIAALALRAPGLWPQLRRDVFFLITVCFVLYLGLRTAASLSEFPEIASAQRKNAAAFLMLWVFVLPIAVSLKGRVCRVLLALTLATAGLILKMVLNIDWGNFPASVLDARSYGFGVSHIGFGLYAGTVLLGLLLFAPRLLDSSLLPVPRWLRIVLWLVLFTVLLQGLIVDSSRAAWLACILVFPVTLLWRYRSSLSTMGGRQRLQLAAGGGVVLLSFIALVWINLPALKERLGEEHQVMRAMLTLDPAKVPVSSVGLRFHFVAYGFEKWLERPVIGWGPGTSRMLLMQHPLKAAHGFPHVHNTYLDALVELGSIGGGLFAAAAVLLLGMLWRGQREGSIPPDLAIFLFGVAAMLSIWSLSNVRYDHVDGRHYHLMLAAIIYAFHLFPGRMRREANVDERTSAT